MYTKTTAHTHLQTKTARPTVHVQFLRVLDLSVKITVPFSPRRKTYHEACSVRPTHRERRKERKGKKKPKKSAQDATAPATVLHIPNLGTAAAAVGYPPSRAATALCSHRIVLLALMHIYTSLCAVHVGWMPFEARLAVRCLRAEHGGNDVVTGDVDAWIVAPAPVTVPPFRRLGQRATVTVALASHVSASTHTNASPTNTIQHGHAAAQSRARAHTPPFAAAAIPRVTASTVLRQNVRRPSREIQPKLCQPPAVNCFLRLVELRYKRSFDPVFLLPPCHAEVVRSNIAPRGRPLSIPENFPARSRRKGHVRAKWSVFMNVRNKKQQQQQGPDDAARGGDKRGQKN